MDMSGAARGKQAMQLHEAVEKYLAVSGGYGKSVPLASFGLSKEETERVFAVFDEDYHISRFFHLDKKTGEAYQINGFPQTHVSIDAEVQTIL
jgi:hypothetical protein